MLLSSRLKLAVQTLQWLVLVVTDFSPAVFASWHQLSDNLAVHQCADGSPLYESDDIAAYGSYVPPLVQ
jgi:hypothetical protein